ncbi:MAG: SRPBCC family protein [Flavobacteriales bacterium]
MTKTITKEKTFNHSIDKVWNAISKGEELTKWFINADFKPEKEFEYTFTSEPNEKGCTTITGKVLEANPYTLIYTWIVAGTSVETTVTWKLTSEGETTKLYLEHAGIEHYSGETALAMMESFEGGWTNCLDLLLAHLD